MSPNSQACCASLLVRQVAEGAKIIAARMPEPFDVRKGHEETFKKVPHQSVYSNDAQEREAPTAGVREKYRGWTRLGARRYLKNN